MNSTLALLRGRRLWAVENLVVWGSLASFESKFLVTENSGVGKRLLFWKVGMGGSVQTVRFEDLVDVRGSSLPKHISRPKVIVLPKTDVNVVIACRETSSSFEIAKTSKTSASGLVDLLIFETGGVE